LSIDGRSVARQHSSREAPGTVFVPLAVRAKEVAQQRQVVDAVAPEDRDDPWRNEAIVEVLMDAMP
jgi:hypothetical protein